MIPLALLTSNLHAADPFILPPIEHLDRLDRWRAGVAAADAQERPLQIVCIGDSNTEGPAYVGELRRILQGCYGERGIGYHSLGNRAAVPESPRIERKGKWDLLRDAPNGPPPPRFALDGIWCQTADPQAEVAVEFVFGGWEQPDYHLARAYNIQQRVRVHHQVGPDLGSFAIFAGPSELRRVDCKAEKAGYAVTDAFLCDGFRIAGVQGRIVLFGLDAERQFYLRGQPALAGGVLVHALGKSWGRTEEPALVEDDAYAKFFGAIHPDLITILLGTNDQHNDGRVPSYRDWLTTIVRKLQKHSPGTGILIMACPEAGQTKAGLAVQFRDAAREVAASNGCAFWNLQDLVGPRSANWAKQGFFSDGLHYHPIGGGLLARLLLRQLGFDLNDLKHYPSLRADAAAAPERPQFTVRRLEALSLDTLAEALAAEAPRQIWLNRDKLAELRLAVAGKSLAVHLQVTDHQCTGPQENWTGGGADLCIANPANVGRTMHNQDGPIVRQVVIRAVKPKTEAQLMVKQFTMDEKNTVIPWEIEGDFPYRITPLQPCGYELRALIPLSLLVLTGESREFLLEVAVSAASAPGGKPTYNRMFATRNDNGAFRDASLSARVKIGE
jgi:lysophospholipase L1-like esterase